ncbi:uncharacterized protein LOC134191378 [Corticium candelabrum]|uniref:uncharacterized protein LOC134191378 n=1 Tax=Corticium candelabrum TaxID=121492 RepID=UPI002E262590|nr:uncharacterized protein LOC134191378 [Corticium candelabrum]
MQRKLLAEDNLPLNTAFKKVQAMEVAELQASKLQQAAGVKEDCESPHQQYTNLNHREKSRRPESEEIQKAANRKRQGNSFSRSACWRCGKTHHKRKECLKCHKTGHMAKMCNSRIRTAQHVSGDQSSSEDEGVAYQQTIYRTGQCGAKIEAWKVRVIVNDREVEMELDTGASNTILSSNTYYKLWASEKRAKLHHTTTRLRAYGGHNIKVLRSIQVTVETN